MKSSEIHKFYEKRVEERQRILKEFAELSNEEIELLKKSGALEIELANRMIENVVGTFPLPLGIATNFKINGKDYLIPMALEEPSVVAAASNAAKLAREAGGFQAKADESIMIGQIQLLGVKDFEKAKKRVLEKKKDLMEIANKQDKTLKSFGGGAKDLELREIEFNNKKMLIVHLLVDVKDAMGANAVNSMVEAIASELEKLSESEARLRIISNLATKRLVKAKAVWKKKVLEKSVKNIKASGEKVVDAIIEAYEFAAADTYRAATHNKGIMNGIDAVAIATGNDFRAIEAGAHSFAALTGKYLPLTKYYKDKEGNLVGEIKLPIAVGIVGGATKTHPLAKLAVKVLKVKSAKQLSEVMASVGLAQNFAALRALATEGIQRGHMKLHSRNIALQVGAKGKEVEIVAEKMVSEKKVSVDNAKKILEELRKK